MGDLISSLLFQPPPPTYLHPSRHFWLTNKYGNRVPAFFIERPNAKVTILFSHGNAEDLGMIYDWFNDLARVLRVNIMAYDYSGYGKSFGVSPINRVNSNSNSGGNNSQSNESASPGIQMQTGISLQPCEEFVYADIEAAYAYLLKERKLQPEEIVLYGRSLGSGPSCYLASKTAKEGRSVAGVILQSPLLSAFRVAFNFRFTMVWDKFPNIDYAPYIRCPVFIVHGTQDEVVPFWHGQDLFMSLEQQWRAKPFWVEGAGHNNIEALLRPSGAFVDKLIEYLDLHVAARKMGLGINHAASGGEFGNGTKGRPSAPRPVPECINASINTVASVGSIGDGIRTQPSSNNERIIGKRSTGLGASQDSSSNIV
uniref:AB hydrolase-1 domain-containing protein n=1 Tax=Chaetoceros debilis TaxID=122233 RepID=A0A7S3PW20_9STRA|eukprot:CAMPEP_0194088800 /NCGR_PEP_ID=MMETSP0149-20130528/31074_1 /TAXON_ID=122233 /ORGANISM="Chaetoceros debilis, Strain MM31A-1" /LENGTH=368 /DNA_ID=CAMNT_0038772541 /DNA_START=18 /DNA_END=1124 /DNA_ORIENTATION=-